MFHRTVTYFISTIFVSMSRPASIYYVLSKAMRSCFLFQSYFRHNQSYNSIKTDTLVSEHFFRISLIIFE